MLFPHLLVNKSSLFEQSTQQFECTVTCAQNTRRNQTKQIVYINKIYGGRNIRMHYWQERWKTLLTGLMGCVIQITLIKEMNMNYLLISFFYLVYQVILIIFVPNLFNNGLKYDWCSYIYELHWIYMSLARYAKGQYSHYTYLRYVL